MDHQMIQISRLGKRKKGISTVFGLLLIIRMISTGLVPATAGTSGSTMTLHRR